MARKNQERVKPRKSQKMANLPVDRKARNVRGGGTQRSTLALFHVSQLDRRPT